MNQSTHEIKLIRILAVLIAILGLAFIYWSMQKKIPEIETQTSKLSTENTQLSETVAKLTQLQNNKDYYEKETNDINERTEKKLLQFPTFMFLEDKILYADHLLRYDLNQYNLRDFNYGQSTFELSTTYGEEKKMELYSVPLSGKFIDLTYAQIKSLLDYGLDSKQRFVVSNLTASFNQDTGYLSGELSFKTFFISGQKRPYQFPQEVIDAISKTNRTDDLFGARFDPILHPQPSGSLEDWLNSHGDFTPPEIPPEETTPEVTTPEETLPPSEIVE